MSRIQETQTSPEERNSETNGNRQPLMEEGRASSGRTQRDERKKNYVSVVLSLLSVILVLGAIVVQKWSRMVAETVRLTRSTYANNLVEFTH